MNSICVYCGDMSMKNRKRALRKFRKRNLVVPVVVFVVAVAAIVVIAVEAKVSTE